MSLSTSALATSRYDAIGYAPTPDMIQAADFKLWPEAMQVDLVRTYGSGRPAMALIGTGAGAAIATLSAGGGTVDVTDVPAGFDAAPRDVPVRDFERWPNAAQIFYALTNGTDGAVDIGPSGASLRVSVTRDVTGAATDVEGLASEGLVETAAPLFSIAPGALSAGSLFALPSDEQFGYASRYSAGTPPTISLAGAGATGTAITLLSNGRPYVVRVPASAYPGFATPVAGQASTVTGFDAWPPAVRAAYLEAQQPGAAYPKALVFGATVWSIAARGADAESVALPAGFATAPGSLDAATFVRWAEPVQVAYLRQNLGGTDGTLQVGASPAVAATLSSTPPALTLSSAATPATPPASLALDLFQLWPEAGRAAYLEQYGSGTPKSIDVAATSGHPRTLIAATEDGRVVTSLVPTGFATSPVTLSPATFLDWPSPLRELYAATQLATSPASLAPTTFLSWQPFFRDRYVATNLAGGATSLTIGDTTDSIAASVTGGQLRLAPSSTPLNAATFRALPDADRLAYLNANGTGTPKTIDVPEAAFSRTVVLDNGSMTASLFIVPRTLIHLDAEGRAAATAFPSNYPAASSAATVAAAVFLAWPAVFQVRFATAHLDTGQTYATIGTSSPTIRATPVGLSVKVTFSPAEFDLATFRLWPVSDRITYFNLNGTGTPKAIVVASSGQLVTVALDGTVATSTLPSEYTQAPTDLDPMKFLEWDRVVQQRYVEDRLRGTSTTLLTIGSSGNFDARLVDGQLSFTTTPARFALSIFALWPAADRIAYFNANATGTPKALVGNDGKFLTVGPDGAVSAALEIPPDYIKVPTELSVRSFLAWPPLFQERYVAEKLIPPAKTLTIGTDRYTLDLTRREDGSFRVSTSPSRLDLDRFREWPPADRVAYFETYATGSPRTIDTVASSKQARTLVTVSSAGVVDSTAFPAGYPSDGTAVYPSVYLGWSSTFQARYEAERAGRPLVATGETSPRPATTSAATFAAWPLALQIAFVNQYGRGTPPAVLIGPSGAQSIVRLTREGKEVDLAPAPSGIATPPASLAVDTFLGWSLAARVFYVENYAQNGRIGPSTGQLSVEIEEDRGIPIGIRTVADADLKTANAAIFGTLPASLTPDRFFSLSPDEQLRYFELKRSGSPQAIRLNGATSSDLAITVKSRGESLLVYVTAATYPGFGTTLTSLKSAVSATTFQSWPPEVQAAYVVARSLTEYPKVVTFGDTSMLAMVRSAEAEVEIVSYPDGLPVLPDVLPSGTTAAQFTAMPEAYQIASIRQKRATTENSVTVFPGNTTATLGPGNAEYTVQIATRPPYVTLATLATPATLPANLDLTMFALWPATDQAAYVAARGTGTPKAVIVPADTSTSRPRTLLTIDERGRVAARTFPTDYAKAPGTLKPLEFQGLEPIFQALYVRENRAAGAASLVIGPAGNQVTVSPSGAGGVFVQEDVNALTVPVTLGQTLEIPYHYLPGSDVGLDANPNKANAETLFPVLDGTAGHTIAVKPDAVAAEFGKGPTVLTAEAFNSWHTAFQLEYLRREMAASTPPATSITIGASPNQVTAFISSTGTKVFVAQNLQKQDIAKMSLADQTTLAGLTVFTAAGGIGERLGLLGGSSALTAMNAQVQTAINMIGDPQNTDKSEAKYSPGGDTGMGSTDKQVFIDELNMLTSSFSKMSIFSTAEIQKQIGEITARFDRVNAFHIYLNENNNIRTNNSLGDYQWLGDDNGAKINQGYAVFMAQERQILALKNASKSLSETGMLQNRALDVPNLVYLFQLYTNLQGEARIRIASEEIDQTNALLKIYSAMQTMVNNTVGSYTGTDTTAKKKLLGTEQIDPLHPLDTDTLTNTEVAIRNMFWGGSLNTVYKHPIEALFGITRPKMNELNGEKESKEWQNFSTSIGDKVTQINQESQIKMNEINSMTKQKDRNFDLANNALTKMSEVLQKIASLA